MTVPIAECEVHVATSASKSNDPTAKLSTTYVVSTATSSVLHGRYDHEQPGTNHTGELLSALFGLQIARQHGYLNVRVLTSSRNAFLAISNRRDGRDGRKPSKVPGAVELIDEFYRLANFGNVRVEWVASAENLAHSSRSRLRGYVSVDSLARQTGGGS